MPRAKVMRVHLACSCRNPKAHHRYARDLDELVRVVLKWYEQGGHGNPNHRTRIQAESAGYVRNSKLEQQLLRRLANRPPERRRPTVEEALAPKGAVLRRYGG